MLSEEKHRTFNASYLNKCNEIIFVFVQIFSAQLFSSVTSFDLQKMHETLNVLLITYEEYLKQLRL